MRKGLGLGPGPAIRMLPKGPSPVFPSPPTPSP